MTDIYPYVMMGITFVSFALLTYGRAAYSFNRRAMRERYRGAEVKTSGLIKGGPAAPSFKKRLLGWLSNLGKLTLRTTGEKTE